MLDAERKILVTFGKYLKIKNVTAEKIKKGINAMPGLVCSNGVTYVGEHYINTYMLVLLSVINNNFECVKYLTDNNFSVGHGIMPAVNHDNIDIFKYIVSRTPISYFNWYNRNIYKKLIDMCCKNKNPEFTKHLIKCGFDVSLNGTGLYLAYSNNNLKVADVICKEYKNIRLNAEEFYSVSKNEKTVRHYVSSGKHIDYFRDVYPKKFDDFLKRLYSKREYKLLNEIFSNVPMHTELHILIKNLVDAHVRSRDKFKNKLFCSTKYTNCFFIF